MAAIKLTPSARKYLYWYLGGIDGGKPLFKVRKRLRTRLKLKEMEAEVTAMAKLDNAQSALEEYWDPDREPDVFDVDEADLEKVHELIKALDRQEGTVIAPPCRACGKPFKTTGADGDVLLPVLEAIEWAYDHRHSESKKTQTESKQTTESQAQA